MVDPGVGTTFQDCYRYEVRIKALDGLAVGVIYDFLAANFDQSSFWFDTVKPAPTSVVEGAIVELWRRYEKENWRMIFVGKVESIIPLAARHSRVVCQANA